MTDKKIDKNWRIEYKKPVELLDHKSNPRKITKERFELLKDRIKSQGFRVPPSVDNDYILLAGHQRIKALIDMGLGDDPIAISVPEFKLTEKERQEILSSDNLSWGEFDYDILANEFEMEDLIEWGFDKMDFGVIELEPEETKGDDDIPESAPPITVKGDLYELGEHRLLCGDSTKIDDVEKLMDGEKAVLAHNDPPYGMKKEKDGIKNDNLNYDDLLEFNKDWINLQFTYLKENGSWYCWGIDEPLMDIYSNIIKPLIKTQKATFRNLITWHKDPSGLGDGQNNSQLRQYGSIDEKCLFVMCGVQGFNHNADNYFDGWEPVRLYMISEFKKLNLSTGNLAGILGLTKTSSSVRHWVYESQWTFLPEKRYKDIQDYCTTNNIDAFKKEYDELKKEYDELKKEYYSTRAYFDNTHDNMTNVWDIGRTKGAEREETGGHATPKPLELCQRVIKSSCPQNGLVIDAFLGSGSTLIACEKTNRKCYGMELDEKYCDVIVKRYVDFCKKNNRNYSVLRNGKQCNDFG